MRLIIVFSLCLRPFILTVKMHNLFINKDEKKTIKVVSDTFAHRGRGRGESKTHPRSFQTVSKKLIPERKTRRLWEVTNPTQHIHY
jgi:hypothetical protein